MPFTRMPWRAHSPARVRVKFTTAPLEVLYARFGVMELPRNPMMDATLMMRPDCRAIIPGPMARAQRK